MKFHGQTNRSYLPLFFLLVTASLLFNPVAHADYCGDLKTVIDNLQKKADALEQQLTSNNADQGPARLEATQRLMAIRQQIRDETMIYNETCRGQPRPSATPPPPSATAAPKRILETTQPPTFVDR